MSTAFPSAPAARATAGAATTTPSVQAVQDVVELEIELLDPRMRRNGAALQELLHPDFVELSPTGHVYDRESVVDVTAADTTEGMTLDHLAAQELAPGVVLVTYRSRRDERTAWRSSLWLQDSSGRWLLRHHQGTPIRGVYSA